MNRRTTLTLATMALLCSAIALPMDDAAAQQKQQVSFKAPPENDKYTQQLTISVGDVPNHNMRVFEIHRTFPNNAPVINGFKLAEEWVRGTSDLTGGNGHGPLYCVFVMENGDKFVAQLDFVNQRISGTTVSTAVGHITSGTGKFEKIQGIVQQLAKITPGTQATDSQTDIEYWIEK
jgi:hypothetical protein